MVLNLSLDRDNDANNDEGDHNISGMYEDFIGFYPKALPDQFCKGIVEAFDYHHFAGGMGIWQEDDQFRTANAGRFDWAMDLEHFAPRMYNGDHPARVLNEVLFASLNNYIHTFGHLKESVFSSTAQKVQKTPAGGGYHVWHDENGDIHNSSRKMVWMVYLNDNYEGGETEFLYYKKRVQPEQGKLIIWPAGLTHCHRGGLVTSGCKYVVTGWFNVAERSEQ